MAYLVYVLAFQFLADPSGHVFVLLPTKEIVIFFSLLGILVCPLVIFLILTGMFRKNAYIKLNDVGIYDGFSFYKNKFIRWEEIYSVVKIRHNYNNYIGIYTLKMRNNERGINRILFQINKSTMGTPYIISSGYLDCSFKELEEAVQGAFSEHKKKTRKR